MLSLIYSTKIFTRKEFITEETQFCGINKPCCSLQLNANQLPDQLWVEIAWRHRRILTLSQTKLQLQRQPVSPLIQDSIAVIEYKISEHKSRLRQLNIVVNGTC